MTRRSIRSTWTARIIWPRTVLSPPKRSRSCAKAWRGRVASGRAARYGREYLVAVRPQKKGLVMYTLHHDAEIRSIDQIEELNSVPSKVKPEEMKLAKQVIGTFDADLNLKDYKDEYKEGLRKIIDAKIAGEEIVAPEIQEPPKVVDLMEALRRSLHTG